MMEIRIENHGTVNIYNGGTDIGEERDKLLTKLYYARNKSTIGGYENWKKLLNMYYMENYAGMKEFISSCKGKGGKTRHECLNHINNIMRGEI